MQTLAQSIFETSRLLEFFSAKERALHMGVNAAAWPLALVNERIDNAPDACESTGPLPQITVTLPADTVTVADNAYGLSDHILGVPERRRTVLA